MLKGLKRLAGGGMLLLELRGLRKEASRLADAVERLAMASELRNAHDYPQQVQRDPSVPVVEVAYVDDAYQAAIMDIEMRLTTAKGLPPSEEEVLQEYERRFQEPGPAVPQEGGIS